MLQSLLLMEIFYIYIYLNKCWVLNQSTFLNLYKNMFHQSGLILVSQILEINLHVTAVQYTRPLNKTMYMGKYTWNGANAMRPLTSKLA